MNITVVTGRVKGNKPRKRVGRGESSGLGKTCGRGNKGMGARTGTRGRLLAEGGMFPLFRRIPKIGFNNANFRTEYQVVNVASLEERFENGSHVTAATLFEAGLIRDMTKPVKILGDGELQKKLTVEAQRFSAEAQRKIETGGGSVKKLGPQPKKKFVKRPPVAEKPEEEKGGKGKSKSKAKDKGSAGDAPAKGAAEASEE